MTLRFCYNKKVIKHMLDQNPGLNLVESKRGVITYGRALNIIETLTQKLTAIGVGRGSLVALDIEKEAWFLHFLIRISVNLLGVLGLFLMMHSQATKKLLMGFQLKKPQL